MHNRLIRMLILATVVAALPLCAAEDKSSMPLAVGNRWEYSVTEIGVMSVELAKHSKSMETEAEGTCVEEVVAVKERRSNGDVVYEHRSGTTTEAGKNSDPNETTVDSLLLMSKSGMYVLASKLTGSDGAFDGKWTKYDPPLVMFEMGMSPGTKWKIGVVREGDIRMPMEAQAAGCETVTVPAGTFKDCLKVYVTCNKVTGSMGSGRDKATIKSGKCVDTMWVAPGIGVVKEDSIMQVKMQFAPDENGLSLVMTGTHRETKKLQPGYKAD